MLDFAYQQASEKRCGCYAIGLPDVPPQKSVLLPLRSCEFQLEVVNAMVNATLLQTYQNPTDKFLEVEYSFPVSPNSCVYRFVAEFGGHRMQGVVKEKEQAKQKYQTAVKEGKRAAYGQQSQKDSDVLILKVGNIGPSERVTIQIQYLHELSLSYNTFYELKVPASVTPRVLRNYPEERILLGYRPHGAPKVEVDFYWSFQISLRTTRKVTFFESSSHKLAIINQNDTRTETLFSFPQACLPNKDFVFTYTTEGYELPSCVFGRSDKSSTAMLSFIPKFCSLSVSDAYKASIQGKTLQGDMESAKGEYVFLLDRSGSMGGKRIQKAKEALVLFIKSLPKDSFFNVVSFGSKSVKLFNDSQRYDNKSIETAVGTVKQMSADLGGTQIYAPLSGLLSEKTKQGYAKHIFLLTDGEVSDTKNILKMIGRSNKYARVHSIGIGNGASAELIKGSAKSGKGEYVFIDDLDDPSEKIIQILADSLSPLISSVSLKFDENIVESIVPNPKSLPYFLKGQLVNFYVTFKGQLSQKAYFSFSYEDSMNKLPYSADIVVDPESPSEPFIDRMGHFKSIRILEDTLANGGGIDDYIYYVKKIDHKAEILRQSVEHQILSQFTAFVCVEKQLVDGKLQEVNETGKVKIVIESTPPAIIQDYDGRTFGSIQSCSPISSSSLSYSSAPPPPSYAPKMMMDRSSDPYSGSHYRMKELLQREEKLDMLVQKSQDINNLSYDFYASAKKKSSGGFFSGITGFFKSLIEKKPEPVEEKKMTFRKESQAKTQINQKAVVLEDKKEKKEEKKEEKKAVSNTTETIKRLVDEQDSDGCWKNLSLIEELFGSAVRQIVSQQQNPFAAAAYLLAKWIEKNHPQKQYSLIVKKAVSFASKDAEQFMQFPSLFDQYIK